MNFLSYRSVSAILKENATKYASRMAISYNKRGVFSSLTYAEFYERVLMLARGLGGVGVRRGDRIAIFSENRLGWAISDFGIQAAGAISVPIYATNTGRQAAYVINHCEARIVFVSTRSQYEKLYGIRDQIPHVELVISYERFMGERTFPVYTQYQLSEVERPLTPEEKQVIEGRIEEIDQEDVLTIIYTSGTTGVPKGVLLTHRNILANISYGLARIGKCREPQTWLSFLPLSHVLERTAGYYSALAVGSHLAFAENVQKVMENMMEIRPTNMVSVPRLFEKIYSRVYENAHQSSPLKRRLFHRAVEVGRQYIRKKYIAREPLGWLELQYRFFDRLVFRGIRERFGGKLLFFLCGGAPLDKTVNEFMWIIGLPVLTGYGLTETSPAVTLTSFEEIRFASVGKPLNETEVRLAADGELFVRGPQVMRQYYKNDEATLASLEDGWFKTGDIASIDEHGYVYIIDRKKELIITAGGKNIAPQPLENELRVDKYISQAYVYGDGKPFLVALLTPNLERLIELARDLEIHYIDFQELVTNDKVIARYHQRLEAFNSDLPSYQTIKRFALLAQDFTIEGGELTPTLKLKRKEIYKKYRDVIEGLYGEGMQRGGQYGKGVSPEFPKAEFIVEKNRKAGSDRN